MLQPIILMIVGLTWLSATLFFRNEIDPLYRQIPLMFSLVLFLLLLTHALVLAAIGRNLGRPFKPEKKNSKKTGIPPPALSFVILWSFAAILALGGGASVYLSQPTLATVLWVIGGSTLVSALSFLLIPTNVHSENQDGEIIFKPNPVRMAPQSIYIWSSAILYGSFFLIAGAILENTAAIGSMVAMGTGGGWLLGALILSLVALFRMGIEGDGQATTKTRLLIPREDFSQIAGLPGIKTELAQILYQIDSAEKSMGHVPNGILLTGPSALGRTLFARALAGEYKRPFYNFTLDSLLSVDPSTMDTFWKGFLFKIKPFSPLVIYLENYGKVLNEAQGNPHGLRNISLFLTRLSRNRTHILVASTDKADEIPETFRTPPLIHWTIAIPLPDLEMRKTLLRKFLLDESRKNELLPGNVPLLTKEMVEEFDLGKLAGLMDGFVAEDIREVVVHSTLYAKKLRRSLRQLDIDVAIRRKAQNWKDPTAGPMEVVRTRLTEETIGPFLVKRAEDLFSGRLKKNHESILIIGRNRTTRKMIAERLAHQNGFNFVTPPDDKKFDGNEFRNLVLRSRKHRPAVVFVDPLDDLFPKVQLSNYGYHGEIYNQKVMELSQASEDKNSWLIAGAEDINRIDPFIARRFASLLDLAELGRSLFAELEEYALTAILEGIPADRIDFSSFEKGSSGERTSEEGKSGPEKPSLRFGMDLPPPEALPGFPGRPETQDAIRSVLEASTFNIRKGGSGLSGAFLFAGPMGTGKRLAAEAIARFRHPEKETLVIRDMGLYSDRLFASFLLQRPLGSTGSSPLPEGLGPVLSQNPESVIFLDNIEKAHPSAWNFLPNYLKDGLIDLGGKPLAVPRSLLILSTSLFSGEEISQGTRPDKILERLSGVNRRLAYLPVFDRQILETLDLIVPFPVYTDRDILDMTRRTVYELLERFSKTIPIAGTLEVDPEIPAFITYQVDPASTTAAELSRKIQSMLLPSIKQLEGLKSGKEPEPVFRLMIDDNRIVLVGVPKNTAERTAAGTEVQAVSPSA